MTVNGILNYKIENNAFNTDLFLIFFQDLCRVLKEKDITSAVIVMDNVPFHKCKHIKEFVETNGYMVMLLPQHFSFLNPIEKEL